MALLCYGSFCDAIIFVHLSHLKEGLLKISENVILTNHLYPMKEHFYPDERGLFQDDPTPNHRAQGFTEWYKYENKVNHMLCPSQSSDLSETRLGRHSTRFWIVAVEICVHSATKALVRSDTEVR